MLTSNFFGRRPLTTWSLRRDGAVLDVVCFAPARSADISFSGLLSTSVANSMFGGTVTYKMPRLLCYDGEVTANSKTWKLSNAHLITNFTDISLLRFRPVRTVVYKMLQRMLESHFQALQSLTSGDSQILHLYPGGGFPGSFSARARRSI